VADAGIQGGVRGDEGVSCYASGARRVWWAYRGWWEIELRAAAGSGEAAVGDDALSFACALLATS
jgi:hypothetical protein